MCLVKFDNAPPIIEVNSPGEGEVYGIAAPSFELSIEEVASQFSVQDIIERMALILPASKRAEMLGFLPNQRIFWDYDGFAKLAVGQIFGLLLPSEDHKMSWSTAIVHHKDPNADNLTILIDGNSIYMNREPEEHELNNGEKVTCSIMHYGYERTPYNWNTPPIGKLYI